MVSRLAVLLAVTVFATSAKGSEGDSAQPTALTVFPAEVTLRGGDSLQRLLVLGQTGSDESRKASYVSGDPKVVAVTADGVISPQGDGLTEVVIKLGDQVATARVKVEGFGVELPVSFRNQVLPIFTKAGCNTGGCHGKASGQNGFKLSLLGFEPGFDYDAVVKEGRGRRLFPARPERSLLLLKSVAAVPHGGGRRFATGSTEFKLLERWISQGAPAGSASDPSVVRVECLPREATVGLQGDQQVLVTAFSRTGLIAT